MLVHITLTIFTQIWPSYTFFSFQENNRTECVNLVSTFSLSNFMIQNYTKSWSTTWLLQFMYHH
jgi:hypothetical protein